MLISRRGLGQLAFAGMAGAARTFAASKKVPIAVQLYSVRQIAQKDLAGVLAQVKKLGFDGVEFAGYYGHEAPEVKKMLDDNKLKVAGTHTALDLLMGDNFSKTVEFMKVIGNKNIIVPSLPQKYRASLDAWRDTAKLFNELSDKLKPQGMVIGYHNHTVEFEKVDGQVPLEVFFNAAKPAVKIQLDVGHARRAGADPVAFIKKYPGRVLSIHIKEYSPDKEEAPLGEGVVDWKGVFNALESSKGIEWYIVEEEGKSCVEYNCIGDSLNRLRKMGK
jgi:sugar phosphate isomerase/epimerase